MSSFFISSTSRMWDADRHTQAGNQQKETQADMWLTGAGGQQVRVAVQQLQVQYLIIVILGKESPSAALKVPVSAQEISYSAFSFIPCPPHNRAYANASTPAASMLTCTLNSPPPLFTIS
jgi:hypothetical protein